MPMRPAATELDLHGLTVDEALFRIDDFLDDCYSSGLHEVRIVHGKGTGTLRQAVWSHLKRNSLVRSFRGGLPYEGGTGVTVVILSGK